MEKTPEGSITKKDKKRRKRTTEKDSVEEAPLTETDDDAIQEQEFVKASFQDGDARSKIQIKRKTNTLSRRRRRRSNIPHILYGRDFLPDDEVLFSDDKVLLSDDEELLSEEEELLVMSLPLPVHLFIYLFFALLCELTGRFVAMGQGRVFFNSESS